MQCPRSKDPGPPYGCSVGVGTLFHRSPLSCRTCVQPDFRRWGQRIHVHLPHVSLAASSEADEDDRSPATAAASCDTEPAASGEHGPGVFPVCVRVRHPGHAAYVFSDTVTPTSQVAARFAGSVGVCLGRSRLLHPTHRPPTFPLCHIGVLRPAPLVPSLVPV